MSTRGESRLCRCGGECSQAEIVRRATAETPPARLWAENLALTPAGSTSAVARRAIRAWLHSPPHRHNLLAPRLDVVGLGVAGASRGVYVTADFADL